MQSGLSELVLNKNVFVIIFDLNTIFYLFKNDELNFSLGINYNGGCDINNNKIEVSEQGTSSDLQ